MLTTRTLVVSRQSYSGSKSTYSTVGTYTCYLRPLTEKQASDNGVQYGLGFEVLTEPETDIAEGDKAVVDGTTYTVQGVVYQDRGAVPFKRAIVVKPAKS